MCTSLEEGKAPWNLGEGQLFSSSPTLHAIGEEFPTPRDREAKT